MNCSCIKTACYFRLYGSFVVSPNVHSFHPSAFHSYNVTIPLLSLIPHSVCLFVFLVSSHSSSSSLTNLSLPVVHQTCLYLLSAVVATCLSSLLICLLFLTLSPRAAKVSRVGYTSVSRRQRLPKSEMRCLLKQSDVKHKQRKQNVQTRSH